MAINRCYVYFHLPLWPEPLFEDDWQVRIDGRLRTLSNAEARVDRVQIDTGAAGPFFPAPDTVRYFNLRNELRGADGAPVAAFIHPITRTPP